LFSGNSQASQLKVTKEEVILSQSEFQKVRIPISNIEEIQVDEFFQVILTVLK